MSLNYFPTVCLPSSRATKKNSPRSGEIFFDIFRLWTSMRFGAEIWPSGEAGRPQNRGFLSGGVFWTSGPCFLCDFGVLFSLIPTCFRDFVVWDHIFWVLDPPGPVISWLLVLLILVSFLSVRGIIFGVAFVVVFWILLFFIIFVAWFYFWFSKFIFCWV